MTAISGAEIALWDIIGKACGQPVYKLIGGRARESLPAYANGWYGACRTAADYAERARDVAESGYRALKFDPFGTAWKTLSPEAEAEALAIVEAVAGAVDIGLIVEFHGRLAIADAIRFMGKLERFDILWCEEPVAPENIELLAEAKRSTRLSISAGERLYTVADFYRLASLRACDIVQMDIAHCGGLWTSKKIAAIAAAQDMSVSPHCSVGPVAFAAAIHFGYSTPNMTLQESFAEYDITWRNDLVGGWDPLANGTLALPDRPGLGLDLDETAIRDHPYKALSFPSLWDSDWTKDFTGAKRA
jgi:galactonate dehydratase